MSDRSRERSGTDAFGNPLPPPPPAPDAYGGGPVPPGAFTPPTGADRSAAPWVLAPWWKRAVAAVVDGVVLAVLATLLFIPLGALGLSADTEGGFAALVLGFLVYLAVLALAALLYQPLMLWRTDGRTVGKLTTGIRVVKADRTPMDLGTAILREVVLKSIAVGFAASFTFGLAYLADWFWPFADDQNRALHDFLVDTRVVDA